MQEEKFSDFADRSLRENDMDLLTWPQVGGNVKPEACGLELVACSLEQAV